MKTTAILVPAVLAVAACTTITPVTPLGGGKYLVAVKRAGNPGDSWSDVKIMAVGQAADYCKRDGREVEVIHAEETGVRGFSPMNVEVTFTCK